eukprot:TRINITY_DN4979_c0_g1_i2.p1 TRINITY_DN4979_c0_g1~~TRINITY_DN4979_c0_g1_i2.p1  ORF type:complete len:611 (+),score=152.70 TRINITY_DN4979_c0_g1_i2:80-1834(+)
MQGLQQRMRRGLPQWAAGPAAAHAAAAAVLLLAVVAAAAWVVNPQSGEQLGGGVAHAVYFIGVLALQLRRQCRRQGDISAASLCGAAFVCWACLSGVGLHPAAAGACGGAAQQGVLTGIGDAFGAFGAGLGLSAAGRGADGGEGGSVGVLRGVALAVLLHAALHLVAALQPTAAPPPAGRALRRIVALGPAQGDVLQRALAAAVPAAVGAAVSAPEPLEDDLAHINALTRAAHQWQWCLPLHGLGDLRVTEHAPAVFDAIRRRLGVDPGALARLCGEHLPQAVGPSAGRSGASLYTTSPCPSVFFKTVTERERETLLQLLPRYAEHMRKYGADTLLQRVVGLYTVAARPDSVDRPGETVKVCMMAMLNVFDPDSAPDLKFDLKGSSLNRDVGGAADSTVVRKDNNWRRDERRIELAEEKDRRRLTEQIAADAKLLAGAGIMDYSLLVGISKPEQGRFRSGTISRGDRLPPGGVRVKDTHGRLYSLGIIDILQTYDTGKRLETALKGIANDKMAISSANPDVYLKRFVDFCEKEVCSVADRRGRRSSTRPGLFKGQASPDGGPTAADPTRSPGKSPRGGPPPSPR